MSEKLTSPNLILIITTTVYSFSSMMTAFFMLGSQSLIWFFISAVCYFIPYALIVAQYTKKYAHRPGSIYDWLKDSLSPKAAFITVFLWYCSYFIWMISLFMKLIIPLSILLSGRDITNTINWFGFSSQTWLAVFSIILVFLITWMNSQGFRFIFQFLRFSGYAMVGLLFMSLIGNMLLLIQNPAMIMIHFKNSLTVPSFFQESSSQLLSQLPFFIFSITAFGGLDTIASLADKTKNSRLRFPKAVILSSMIVLLLYVSGIIVWSGANDIQQLRQISSLHLGNLMYGLMENLARTLAESFNLSPGTALLLKNVFVRYTAFTMAIAYFSLLSSISYGPLKSLIHGTGEEFWSDTSMACNDQRLKKALWLQASLVAVSICVLSFSNSFLSDLFNQLTFMTNVSRALPYFIVAASFPFFLKKNIIKKEALIIKNYFLNYMLALSVCVCIFIAIAFQVYEPLKLGNYLNFTTLIFGPLAFGLVAHRIYIRFGAKKYFPATAKEKRKNL